MHPSSRKAFTLIELLVVIAIIAILAVVVVLTLNPAELLRQSRDSNRLSDLATLTSAINLYNTDQSGASSYSLGSASNTYISVPDPSATSTEGDQCQGLGMPTSTSYHCAESSTYRQVSGSGWLPINFSKITSGAPIGSLPVDPTNQTSSGLYYSYGTNGSTFELAANPESQKYTALAIANPSMFTAGSNTSLITAGGIANGSVSQANMKLSVASNTAFVDFNSAGTLTPYIGDELVISDSGGHQLVGYIKAAGTGETYGSELLPNTAFANTTNVGTNNASIAAITSGCHSSNCLQVTPSSGLGGGNELFTVPIGSLLKTTIWIKAGTETANVIYAVQDTTNYSPIIYDYGGAPSSWTQLANYATTKTNTSQQETFDGNTAAKTSLFDTPNTFQVLTPSSSGVTIVSTAGGSSYNWTSEDPSFNPDDSGGYTYSIIL